MASILIGAGILSYESIKKSRAKRAQKKAFNTTRFSELERENASRIAHLQGQTCFCQTSDWTGGGCDIHGYVPAAGEPGGPPAPAPDYSELDTAGAVNYSELDTAGAVNHSELDTAGAVREGGTGDHVPDAVRGGGYERTSTTARAGRETYPDYRYRRGEEDGALAEKKGPPRPMGEEEVRRINEERRKTMKAGGFSDWVSRRKGRRGSDGDAVVR